MPHSLAILMKLLPDNFRQRLLPIILSQGIGLICGIAGVRLTSQWVDPTDYGYYGIFISLIPLGAGVIYIGLIKFMGRHWQGDPDPAGLLDQVFRATLCKIPWLGVASIPIAIIAAPSHPVLYGLLFFASSYLLSLTGLAQAALQAAREHWRDLSVSAGLSVTRSFLPPLFYYISGGGISTLFIGFLSHAILSLLVAGSSLHRWLTWNPPERLRPDLPAQYSGMYFIIPAIIGWILLGLNRWLVAWFFGAEISGYFALASNVGLILPAMLSIIMQQYYQPNWFAANYVSRQERQVLLQSIDQIALIYTLLALGLSVALHVALPLLIGSVIGIKYQAATGFVFVTSLSTIALSLCTFYHLLLLSAKRESACTKIDLSGAACLIIGSLISATAGLEWFKRWLMISPAVPWLVNRTLARRALLLPA
jgi:hypothetical protein